MKSLLKSESGRSMIEMLAVLTIIGVLSVAGIAGYTTAMNKHKANELFNEAGKRAIVVSSQIAKGATTLSLAEFGNTTVQNASFDVIVLEKDQFAITISQIDKAVCRQMLTMLGPKTAVRKMAVQDTPTVTITNCLDDGTAYALVYNNDLSTEFSKNAVIDESINNEDDCVAENKTWCAKLNGTGACSNVTDCCTGVSVSTCQKCVSTTGQVVDKVMSDVCDANGDGTNEGVCAPYTMTGTTCSGSDDCGSGEACEFGYCIKPSNTMQCLPVSCTQLDSCCMIYDQSTLLGMAQELLEAGRYTELVTYADQANILQCTYCYGDNIVQNKEDGEQCSVVEINTETGETKGVFDYNPGYCIKGRCQKDLCDNKNLSPCQKCNPSTGEVMDKLYGDTCDTDSDGTDEGSCAPLTMTGSTCSENADCGNGQECMLGYCVQPSTTMNCLPVQCSYTGTCCMNFNQNTLLQQAQELLAAGKYTELVPYADQANTAQCSQCDSTDGEITPMENGTSCSFIEINVKTGEVNGVDDYNNGKCVAGRCVAVDVQGDDCADGYVEGAKLQGYNAQPGPIQCMACPTNGESFYAFSEGSCLKCPGYTYDAISSICSPVTCSGMLINIQGGRKACFPCDSAGLSDIELDYNSDNGRNCETVCPNRKHITDMDGIGYCILASEYEDLYGQGDLPYYCYERWSFAFWMNFDPNTGDNVSESNCSTVCPNREWLAEGCSLKECPENLLENEGGVYSRHCASCDATYPIYMQGADAKTRCESTCPNREMIGDYCRLKTCPSGTVRVGNDCKSCDKDNPETGESGVTLCNQCPNRQLVTNTDGDEICVLKLGKGMTLDRWGDSVLCSRTDSFEPLTASSCVSDCRNTPFSRKIVSDRFGDNVCVLQNCPRDTIMDDYGNCVSCEANEISVENNPSQCTQCSNHKLFSNGYWTSCRKKCPVGTFLAGEIGDCEPCNDGPQGWSTYDVEECSKCSNASVYTNANGKQTCITDKCGEGYFMTYQRGCVPCSYNEYYIQSVGLNNGYCEEVCKNTPYPRHIGIVNGTMYCVRG